MKVNYTAHIIMDITGKSAEEVRLDRLESRTVAGLLKHLRDKYGDEFSKNIANSDNFLVLKNGMLVKKKSDEVLKETDVVSIVPVVVGG